MLSILWRSAMFASLTLAAHAIPFNFSFQYGEDDDFGLVTGTFDGDDKHGFIYDITNLEVYFNGTPFPKPEGQLYIAEFWGEGEAVMSFEGWRNNFVITNKSGSYLTDPNYFEDLSYFMFYYGQIRTKTPEIPYRLGQAEYEYGIEEGHYVTAWSLTSPMIKPDITEVPDAGGSMVLLALGFGSIAWMRRVVG